MDRPAPAQLRRCTYLLASQRSEGPDILGLQTAVAMFVPARLETEACLQIDGSRSERTGRQAQV
jgi:hypothetical protein